MKGTEAKLVSYMQGSDKRFIIPVYQRNYDWKLENCKQLYDDLVKIIVKDRKAHFFGSIVSVHSDGEYNEFLIIDGQQRLTTISLLMLAMYNAMKQGFVVPEQANLPEKIYKTYLIDEWQEDETRIKLKPVKNDNVAFSRLFGDREEHIFESNLTINYDYFLTRIQKEEISVDELYIAMTRLEIINITLNQEDDPQLIFESLNSTGLALSEGDKIRNYILMGLSAKEQNEFYDKYWNKIELCTGYEVSLFVRDYLSVKLQAIPSMSKIYITFKGYVEEAGLDAESLLKDLYAYAKWYEILLIGKTPDRALNACIYRLNRLETTVTRPFFLDVLKLREEGKLDYGNVRQIFEYTESYLFRRNICDLPTNALNKIFLLLHKEIIRFEGNDENYTEKFKYALLAKAEHARLPRDEEFIDRLSNRLIYQMNSKNKIYIFERLENFGTIEDKDIYRHCDEGTYSIEHIMPQHLTPSWIAELGLDYEEIHDVWLHRLANLTLTGYNSKYSNNSFIEKRDMEQGFRQSGLRMNMWVAAQERWTLAELEARDRELTQRALKIWSCPESTYVPADKQYDYYTLEDDYDFTGRLILKFSFKGIDHPADSWISMFEQVLKILHAEDRSVLSKLAHERNSGNDLTAVVSESPVELRAGLQIDSNIYVEKNTSTEAKITLLRKFFKQYDVNAEDLILYLRDTNEELSKMEDSTRHERRRTYWAFALDYIHEAHGTNGPFSNVNASKENWINGSIGISGFNITCVANNDGARVDLYLGKADKEKNKAAYDFLFSHKEQIERKLGSYLEWNRNDDAKRSSVTYRLHNVSIANDADWTQMAKFHGEWSKKFYDVMVPMLLEWSE